MAPSPSLPRDRTKLTSTEFDLPRLDNDAHETEICLPIVNDIIIPILKTEVAKKAMPRKRRVLKNDGLLAYENVRARKERVNHLSVELRSTVVDSRSHCARLA